MTATLDLITHVPVTVYPREREIIENAILGQMFPWYYIGQQTMNKSPEYLPEPIRPYISQVNSPFLSHTLLRRTEDESVNHTDRPLTHFSEFYEFFIVPSSLYNVLNDENLRILNNFYEQLYIKKVFIDL
jgi:hypothetical protein